MVAGSGSENWVEWASEPLPGRSAADWSVPAAVNIELELFMAGGKPAVKVEDRSPAEVAELRLLAGRMGAFVEVVERDSGPSPEERGMDSATGSRLSQVFLSREESFLPLLAEMERRERRGGNQRREAMNRSGEMLGYPPCCVRFFANLPRQDDQAVLEAYGATLAKGVPSHPYFNIFPPMISPITWYPCSFDCAQSSSLAGKGAALLQTRSGDAAVPLGRLSGVTLVFQRFLFVHLHNATLIEEWVEYDGVSDALSWTQDPLFVEAERVQQFRRRVTEPLAAGCALRVEGAAMEVAFDDGRPALLGVVRGAPLVFHFSPLTL